jgi:hypothetical protein
MQEPREPLVRDVEGEGADHVRLMMDVIGRVTMPNEL